MRAKWILSLQGMILLLGALSGCAQLLGNLRRDLDDGDPYGYNAPPTVGGRWAERGFLADSMPEGGSVAGRYVGHAERDPASGSYGGPVGSRSWITPERADSNRREAMRGADDGGPTPSTDPVMEPAVRRQYKNGSRATRSDFVDESQNEGSLWASDGQTNYYFTKNKIRGVGDIVTITVEDGLVRDVGLEARRSLTPRERAFELDAAQERLKTKTTADAKDKIGTSAAAPARTPASGTDGAAAAQTEVEVPQATYADVDMSKSLEIKTGDTMMGEIIDRYPNGNYKVRATKKVPYKGGAPRLVSLIGVVKGSDISEEDVVGSGKLYEYRVETAR